MATRVDRARRRRHGLATYRLVRYADDFVVMVVGTPRRTPRPCKTKRQRCSPPSGLRLSEEKTMIVHIDEGFDFLGFRIQRQTKRGSTKRFVYTWPSKKALASIKAKVRADHRAGNEQPLSDLLRQLNAVLRGWTTYFRHGVSKATFGYLTHFTWRRVVVLAPPQTPPSQLEGSAAATSPTGGGRSTTAWPCSTRPAVPVTRYRYRGTNIPTPWATTIATTTG